MKRLRHFTAALSAGRPMLPVIRRNHREFLLRADRPAVAAAAEPRGLRDHRLRRLEAILFLAREPLSTRKLSQYANLADGTEARTLIGRLNKLYAATGCAFQVQQIAGGYQLLSRPQFATWVRRLDHVSPELRLSPPALETLAVIAYRQPVLRAEIEAIRGVNCGEVLRQLMERNLVRIGGRSEELGRPYLYATTKQFLCTFGLRSLDQLPHVNTMRSLGREPGRSAITPANCDNQPNPDGHDANEEREDAAMPVLTRSQLRAGVPHRESLDDESLDDELPRPTVMPPVAEADDEDFDEEDEDEADDDEDDDLEDFDDEEDEEEEEFVEKPAKKKEDVAEEEDEDFDDDDDDDDEWEEVEDDEDDDEWDDEEEEDWDFDDDDDEDDDEEEEEEEEDWE